jgi:elongation factor P
MNNESYETVSLSKEIMEDKLGYLKEGEQVVLRYFDGSPISIELPVKVELKVKETPLGVRGDTSGGGTKPAILETGMTISVPLFIKEGDTIRINTQTGEYAERVSG